MSTLDVCATPWWTVHRAEPGGCAHHFHRAPWTIQTPPFTTKLLQFLWGTLDVSDWASRVCLDGDQKRPSLIKFFCVFSAADIWGFDWISFESQPWHFRTPHLQVTIFRCTWNVTNPSLAPEMWDSSLNLQACANLIYFVHSIFVTSPPMSPSTPFFDARSFHPSTVRVVDDTWA